MAGVLWQGGCELHDMSSSQREKVVGIVGLISFGQSKCVNSPQKTQI